jgi:hypothetical protein
MVELADFVNSGPLQLFLVLLGSGGILGGTYEWIRDWFAKRREEYLEIAKYKIETISKVRPKYVQLSTNFNALYDQLHNYDTKEFYTLDYYMCLYYICNILSIREAIRTEVGALQLGSLLAEDCLEDLSYEIVKSMEDDKDLGPNSIYKMTRLINNNVEYQEFLINIRNTNKDIYTNFVKWLHRTHSSTEYQTIKESCGCFAYLLIFEVNRIYKIWYNGKEPKFDDLPDYIGKYLQNNKRYRTYYWDISLSGTSRMHKTLSKLQI